jgi:lipoate-protein ligase A
MQILISPSHNPAFNLAAEEYLFLHSSDDVAFLYVNDSCVVLGSNQVLRNELNQEFCRIENIPVLRRMSGGGTVYHDAGNLNYSFITQRNGHPADMNGAFLQPVVAALSALGIDAKVGQRKDLWIAQKYKISGTASHISRGRELHHGTLLFDADLQKLQKALAADKPDHNLRGTASVPSPVMNIREYMRRNGMPDMNSAEFVTAFISALALQTGTTPQMLVSEPEITVIMADKYNSDAWNLRK